MRSILSSSEAHPSTASQDTKENEKDESSSFIAESATFMEDRDMFYDNDVLQVKTIAVQAEAQVLH